MQIKKEAHHTDEPLFVPGTGLEPAHQWHYHLKIACLPVPPSGHPDANLMDFESG